MSSKQDLERSLEAVIARPTTTISRTDELVPLVPHLEFQEVEEILTAQSGSFTNFISPPTRIRGAEHVFTLSPRVDDGTRQLTYAFCHRRREAYACCPAGVPPEHRQREFAYRERVSNYSETHWGQELSWDHATQIIEFEVVDPNLTDAGGGLFPVSTVTASMSAVLIGEPEDEEEFAPSDCPFVEGLARHIIDYSALPIDRLELRGNHLVAKVFNCAFCGGGIGETGCNFCGLAVASPHMQSRIPWHHPLPMEIANASGVRFETNPLQALKCAYQRWAAKDYTPPQLTIQPRQQRSVVLREDGEG